MTKHSPHKRWKGHCSLCAHWNGKDLSAGDTERTPFRVLRKLGVSRKYRRNKTHWNDEA